MTTTAERVNNAIAALDWRMPGTPEGSKRAVSALAQHWVRYWGSAERRLAPPLTQAAKLERYVAWYARAWALAPEALRAELAHPSDLDASVWAAVEDQVAYMLEGNEAAARAAAASAAALASELKSAAPRLVLGLVIVGGVATCVLLAAARLKPRWL